MTAIGSFSILTAPVGAGTWSVIVYAAAGDPPLRRLRDPERWAALLWACPRRVHWLDGEPLSGVLAMGGIVDRHRRLDGLAGLVLAGDAWACTNPWQGCGMALALLHASGLRDTVREHLGDPGGFAAAWGAITEAELGPGYRETGEEDRDRLREMGALRDGRHYVRPPGSTGPLPQAPGRGGAWVVWPRRRVPSVDSRRWRAPAPSRRRRSRRPGG